MNSICPKVLCTGCAACMNICPTAAISMLPDERGFGHPTIDQNRCVDCQRCVQVCPQNERKAPETRGNIYAALAVDDKIRAESSSGGLFSLLAETVLRKGGVVFGAALQEDLHVRHIMVADVTQLHRLRGSKYVQSEIGTCYAQAKEFLHMGKNVLFSGTPCQIAALKSFLGKEYDNLLTVDILCHGVPSPAVFRKFIDSKRKETDNKVVYVNFRKKDPGWSAFSTEISYENGTTEIDNSFYYFFVGDYMLRRSCSECLYARSAREGDITLGDFWGYCESGPEHIENDDLGISFVSVNTPKGEEIFHALRGRIDFAPRTIEEAVTGNRVLGHPCCPHGKSAEFWSDFPQMSWDELVAKYEIHRDKKADQIPSADRQYYARPYRARHRRHLIHCVKTSVIRRLKGR